MFSALAGLGTIFFSLGFSLSGGRGEGGPGFGRDNGQPGLLPKPSGLDKASPSSPFSALERLCFYLPSLKLATSPEK